MSGPMLGLGRLMVSYSAAGGLAMLLNLAGIVVVVRTISVERFGLADLVRTAQWFLACLLSLHIFRSASRFYFDSTDREEQRRILGGGLTFHMVGACAAGLLLLLIYPLGRRLFHLALEPRTIWLAALSIPTGNLVEALTHTAVIRGLPTTYAALVLSQAGLNVAGIYVFVVWLSLDVDGYFLALLLAGGVTGLVGYWVLADHYRWGGLVGSLRRYLRFGAPFTFTEVIHYAFRLVSRLLLVRLAAPEALGWYGFAERAQVPMNVAVGAAGRVWIPWLLAERPGVFQSVSSPVGQVSGVVLMALGGSLIFLRELIGLAGGERYGPAYLAALLLLIAGWVNFIGDWILSASLTMAKQTHYRIWVYAISYGVAGVTSAWTIAWWGSTGLAIAVVVASVLIFLGMLASSSAVHPLKHGLRKLIPASCFMIGLALWGGSHESFWPKPIFLAGYLALLWLLGLLPARNFRLVLFRA